MAYVFNTIMNSMKKGDKAFKPSATASESSSNAADADVESGQTKAQSQDTPRMKDYLTQNSMSYDTAPTKAIYEGADKRTQEQEASITSAEKDKFNKGVSNVAKPTWNAPEDPVRITRLNGEDINARPSAVDENAYGAQKSALQDYINKVKGGYVAGTESIAAPQTEQAKDLLTSRLGRRGLLTRQYEGETPHYTEGMQTLDSALAERTGVDTRQAGEDYKNVASKVDQAKQRLEGLRSGYAAQQEGKVNQANAEIGQVDNDLQRARNIYSDLDQQYEEQRLADDRKAIEDAQKAREQAALEADIKRQEAANAATKQQEAIEAQNRQDYNDYITNYQANVITKAKNDYEAAVQAKRDLGRQAAEEEIALFFTMLSPVRGQDAANNPAAFSGDNYTAFLDKMANDYGVRIQKSELPAIIDKYMQKYGSQQGIWNNRVALNNNVQSLKQGWLNSPTPDIQQFYPSVKTYDSYDSWKVRNER